MMSFFRCYGAPARALAAALLLSLGAGGCGSLGLTSDLALEPRTDAVIATNIKAKLIDDPSLDAAAIRVESDDGAVTLDGFVGSEQQRRDAEALAGAVAGVTGVVNRLTVKQ